MALWHLSHQRAVRPQVARADGRHVWGDGELAKREHAIQLARTGDQLGVLAGVFRTVRTNVAGQLGTTSCTDSNAIGSGPFLYRVGVQP